MVSVPVELVIVRPLMLVAVAAPRVGVTNTGLVANATVVPLPVVVAATGCLLAFEPITVADRGTAPPLIATTVKFGLENVRSPPGVKPPRVAELLYWICPLEPPALAVAVTPPHVPLWQVNRLPLEVFTQI